MAPGGDRRPSRRLPNLRSSAQSADAFFSSPPKSKIENPKSTGNRPRFLRGFAQSERLEPLPGAKRAAAVVLVRGGRALDTRPRHTGNVPDSCPPGHVQHRPNRFSVAACGTYEPRIPGTDRRWRNVRQSWATPRSPQHEHGIAADVGGDGVGHMRSCFEDVVPRRRQCSTCEPWHPATPRKSRASHGPQAEPAPNFFLSTTARPPARATRPNQEKDYARISEISQRMDRSFNPRPSAKSADIQPQRHDEHDVGEE